MPADLLHIYICSYSNGRAALNVLDKHHLFILLQGHSRVLISLLVASEARLLITLKSLGLLPGSLEAAETAELGDSQTCVCMS